MLASASVHTALVITANNSTNITLPGTKGSVMNIKIQEQHKKDIKKSISKDVATKLPVSKSEPATEKTARKNYKKITNKTTTNNITITVSEEQQEKSKARVLSIIYKKLNQHFTYPKLAQKRNWQGKVLLSLRVSSSGEINNVQLHKSSGYSLLDQAAIDSLIKVKQLPQISSWLPYDINLKLPVIYQLTKG